MAKKDKVIMEILEGKVEKPEPMEESSESESEIQIKEPKVAKKKGEVKIDKRFKENHERTEKQQEAWEKALAKRRQNLAEKKSIKEKAHEEMKQVVEQKIVKKAISIKKKEIKKQAVLDEISDDETPIEEIKKIVRAPKPKRVPQPYQEPERERMTIQYM